MRIGYVPALPSLPCAETTRPVEGSWAEVEVARTGLESVSGSHL